MEAELTDRGRNSNWEWGGVGRRIKEEMQTPGTVVGKRGSRKKVDKGRMK